jgi:hypothetical protein
MQVTSSPNRFFPGEVEMFAKQQAVWISELDWTF